MDLSTIIGFAIGLTCIAGGIAAGGDIGVFVDVNALLIVAGGVFAATFIMFPMRTVIAAPSIAFKAFRDAAGKLDELIDQLVALSRLARTNGILALEDAEKELSDPFLKKGIQLAVDGNEESLIRFVMSTDVLSTRERHAVGKKLFKSMGMMALAFGLVGTLIGLVNLFGAEHTAVAAAPALGGSLLPLLYGVVAASLIFFPLAAKLEFRSREEALAKEVITEGIISIMQGVNPRVLKDKLEAFVAPGMRRNKRDGSGGAGAVNP